MCRDIGNSFQLGSRFGCRMDAYLKYPVMIFRSQFVLLNCKPTKRTMKRCKNLSFVSTNVHVARYEERTRAGWKRPNITTAKGYTAAACTPGNDGSGGSEELVVIYDETAFNRELMVWNPQH